MYSKKYYSLQLKHKKKIRFISGGVFHRSTSVIIDFYVEKIYRLICMQPSKIAISQLYAIRFFPSNDNYIVNEVQRKIQIGHIFCHFHT